MGKYLFLFMGLAGPVEANDEVTRAYGERWRDYMVSLAQAGKMESGLPLEPRAIAVTADSTGEQPLQTVDVYGYMVVDADSLDDAVATARRAPHMALGGTTVIRPCIPVGA